MVANGVLIGVVAAESERALAFGETEQLVLTIAGQLVAGALEREEILDRADRPEPESLRHPTSASVPDNREWTSDDAPASPPAHRGSGQPVHARLRFYPRDGSTFIDDEYVIKGVAGRLLWKLANESVADGRRPFTNREVRRDPRSRCRASTTTSRVGSCSSSAGWKSVMPPCRSFDPVAVASRSMSAPHCSSNASTNSDPDRGYEFLGISYRPLTSAIFGLLQSVLHRHRLVRGITTGEQP